MSAYAAEFFGTMLLILLGNGAVAGVLLKDSKGEQAGWVAIVLAWGLAVMIAIYAVGRISGAHLNPAVTLALVITGSFPAEQMAGYVLAQVAGAFAGAALVWIYYLPHWGRTDNAELKRAAFCTSPAIRSVPANLFSEVVATTVLILAILLIGANKFAEGLNPVAVGALIAAIGFGLGGTTGFAINPARDLGPRIAHAILPIAGKGPSDWGYSWIPVAAPLIGSLVAAYLFKYLF
jgi:glycerol uptake facilitator protein